jgi:hypothetical protein
LVTRQVMRPRQQIALGYAWRCTQSQANPRAGLGLALQWWLQQLDSPTTRRALLERHAGPPL